MSLNSGFLSLNSSAPLRLTWSLTFQVQDAVLQHDLTSDQKKRRPLGPLIIANQFTSGAPPIISLFPPLDLPSPLKHGLTPMGGILSKAMEPGVAEVSSPSLWVTGGSSTASHSSDYQPWHWTNLSVANFLVCLDWCCCHIGYLSQNGYGKVFVL